MDIMEIGGVRILTAAEDLPVCGTPDPPYAAFFHGDSPCTDLPEIRIRLTTGTMPDTKPMKQIFNSGQPWSMFEQGDENFMLFQPAAFTQPVWIARFRRDAQSITVYCGDVLIREVGGVKCIVNPVRYPMDQLLLMYFLAPRQGMLVHAAAMTVGDKCLVFPGKSRAGKSTLARQLLADGASVLTDDRVILRGVEGELRAYGTPWPGEAGIALNESRQLAGIFFIRHGEKNEIREMGMTEALERLMPVTTIAWYDPEVFQKILSFCETVVSRVPAGEILFKPGVPVKDLLERFIASR